MNNNRIIDTIALAGLVLALTGCETVEKYSLTYRLWDNGEWRNFNQPAPSPNLALFNTTNQPDVLVEYDALSEKRSTVERQAYYLEQNEPRVTAGKKPKLVGLSAADGMKPIPVLPTQSAVGDLPPESETYAVTSREGRGFTLHKPADPEATFDLPVYPETAGTPIRVVLTPFAVAGDTVMVGLVAAFVGFLLWVQSGAPH